MRKGTGRGSRRNALIRRARETRGGGTAGCGLVRAPPVRCTGPQIAMDTLVDLIRDPTRFGRGEALVWFNGFRTWRISYRELYAAIGGFSSFLDSAGIAKGDRILIWGEN